MTKDEDFANMAALGGDAPTVVWVPVGNTRRAALLAWFEPLIDEVVSWSRRAIGSSSCAEPTARLRPNLLGSPLPLPVAWLRVSVLPPCSDRRTSREPDQKTDSRCSVQEMTLGTLIKGLALLLLLLIATGQLGNLRPVELLMWLSLVVSWITWWVTRRARARATP